MGRTSLSERRLAWQAVLAAVLLPGCGFQLRRPPTLSFSTIQLVGFRPGSPFTEELRRSIEASAGTRVVESAAEAQVILEAMEDVRSKSVASQTAAGQVREFTLRTRLRFRVRTPSGRILIPPTDLLLFRQMTYNETEALAKEYEEATLNRAMQSDIVDQIMRRLATIPPL
jgi:LPS-assembly lipoprotein